MLFRLIAGVVLLAAMALPAQAQLGGLARKMKEKAVQAAVEKAGLDTKNAPAPPTYDDVILELTPARIDGLVRGLGVHKQVLEANGGLAALMQRHDDLDKQASGLQERVNAVSSGYDNAHNRWSSCESDVRNSLEKGHEDQVRKATAAIVANPAGASDKMKAAAAAQQILAKAIADDDSLALKKATAAYYRIWGIDLDKDDAVVAAKCGAPPAKPSVMLELEKVEAQRDTIEVQARALESRAILDGSKAAGMTEQQFAMARERAQMALGGTRTRFSKAELAALDARKAELAPYTKP